MELCKAMAPVREAHIRGRVAYKLNPPSFWVEPILLDHPFQGIERLGVSHAHDWKKNIMKGDESLQQEAWWQCSSLSLLALAHDKLCIQSLPFQTLLEAKVKRFMPGLLKMGS